ncbi:hypothetical protein P9968_06605 [Glaesserella parasuis]|nr:hypothetical protein [Glaesserella parasuis]MDG6323040.1 hypothetical protein [Glaesserella parasuis]
MGENFERGKERAKHTQDMVTGNVNSQRGYVGNIAESSKKVIDDAFDRK